MVVFSVVGGCEKWSVRRGGRRHFHSQTYFFFFRVTTLQSTPTAVTPSSTSSSSSFPTPRLFRASKVGRSTGIRLEVLVCVCRCAGTCWAVVRFPSRPVYIGLLPFHVSRHILGYCPLFTSACAFWAIARLSCRPVHVGLLSAFHVGWGD